MALDQFTTEQIHAVVEEWIAEGKMFTAFEVSLAVKERGVDERHRNMRDFVHEVIFEHGGPANYTRTLMDVGAPEQAWVYHPMSTNPYSYRPLDRDGGDRPCDDEPVTLPMSARTPAALVWSVNTGSVPDGAYGTDQRGRLCIPVALLANIGVGADQHVKVECQPDKEQLIVTKLGAQDPQTADATYTVEPDGNVRLTQTTLDKANIADLPCYNIEGNDKAITVRKFV
jgi:hypothetical protein